MADQTDAPRTPPAVVPLDDVEQIERITYSDVWREIDNEREQSRIKADYYSTFINDENLSEGRRADARHAMTLHRRRERIFERAMTIVDTCGSDDQIKHRLAAIARIKRAAEQAEIDEIDS